MESKKRVTVHARNAQVINNDLWETVNDLSWEVGAWKYRKLSPEKILNVNMKLRKVIDQLNKQALELDIIESLIGITDSDWVDNE